MTTPEEIEKIITPQQAGLLPAEHPHQPPRYTLWLILFLIVIIVGVGAYLLIASGFGQNKSIDIQKKGNYLLYRPTAMEAQTVKRLVLVIPPGGTEAENRDLMQQWAAAAQRGGFALAAVLDWDRNTLTAFLQNVRSQENVSKIYVSGFSNGGYNSCAVGLALPLVVSGVIPMGAYCSTTDATQPASRSVPILTVYGSQDTWAGGEDGQQPRLAGQGLNPEYLIVPNLGHAFPSSVMDQVADWIMAH